MSLTHSMMQAPSAGSQATRAQASLRVQQALEGITRLSKGFSLALCMRSRPKIGALLQRPLQTALQIPLVSSACPVPHWLLHARMADLWH